MEFVLTSPCHFGLEKCLKKEISMLGYETLATSDGRVSFRADEAGIARANIFLRTAERVLVKACEFEARSWDELFESARAVEWEKFIPQGGRVWVAKASSIKSALFSPRDFQTIIQKAVVERLKQAYHLRSERIRMDGALFALRVSANKDVISIYIDTSGESLHKRGYRLQTSKAPISETLAASLLMLTTFGAARILIDPFAGSGTFPIEAAMMAADIAPGMERNFASADWTHLIDKKLWHAAYDEARGRRAEGLRRLGSSADIEGFDIDPAMKEAASANAARAGVERITRFETRDVRNLAHKGKGGIIIANPPYGERMEEKEGLDAVYSALGQRWRSLDDFDLYLISAYSGAQRAIGAKAAKNRKVYNGMIKSYFYTFPARMSSLPPLT